MRRLFTLIFSLCALVGVVRAERVSPERAEKVARQILGEATRSGDLFVAWDSSIFAPTRVELVDPTFYVVSPSSGLGFVIVAGDDNVAPILAYSTTYRAPISGNLPKNFEGWLRYVDGVVRHLRDKGVKADSATAQLWSQSYTPVDALMLNTARWSQTAPYNNECPIDGDAHSLTGCTQTAMAIIMNHHRWPERAKGTTEAYTTKYGLDVASRSLNHAYDWDNMLETYVDGEYNDLEASAVATIMADLGHAFKAEYTATDTGAMPNMLSLYENFSYSPASAIIVRNGNSDSYWKGVLRRELEANRPIFYAGYTAEWAGHAFVLDGVDANDYFHVNWGWGGVYDGFFLLDSLTLGEEYLFDTQHWAVLGMHPMRDGEVDNWLVLSSTGLSVNTREYQRDEQFTIKSISYSNLSQLSFKGEMRVGVCSASGERKSWATEPFGVDIGTNYATSEQNIPAIVRDEIIAGDYLAVFYKSNGSESWFRMYGSAESATDRVVMRYPLIGDTTSLSFDKESGVLVVEYDDDVRSALYLLGEYVETGVTITTDRMIVDTSLLSKGASYTIYLVRHASEESKSIMFTLNDSK